MLLIALLLLLTTNSIAGAIPQGVASRSPNLPQGIQTSSNEFAKEAYVQALKLGIDPAGPHPLDFDKRDGNVIYFKDGSHYGIWAAAQGARTDQLALERRNSDLNLIYWSKENCKGNGKHVTNPDYGSNYADQDIYDYAMSVSRGIDRNYERIWVKRWNNKYGILFNWCAIDLDFYVWGDPGCAHVIPAFSCAMLEFTTDRSG
ncbi:hypothetical protein BDD12DRAFT_883805 [Trichophaea hybrida]|nr:hypothetical protein BDD12DRAFT_883805 [Trichophaea hybrida]